MERAPGLFTGAGIIRLAAKLPVPARLPPWPPFSGPFSHASQTLTSNNSASLCCHSSPVVLGPGRGQRGAVANPPSPHETLGLGVGIGYGHDRAWHDMAEAGIAASLRCIAFTGVERDRQLRRGV